MTDQLLQKIEDKMMALLRELEHMRSELSHAREENSQLKSEKAAHAKKLQSLITALDAFESAPSVAPSRDFELVQAEEEAESAIA